jgi:hypothetical protein
MLAARLRALSCVSGVGVRVSLGALKSPADAGLFAFIALVPSSPLGTWAHVADNMGTAVGTPQPPSQPVSVQRDRAAWVVRWRQDGQQRARRFATEPEALAFDEGISGGARPRSSTPNVYRGKLGDRRHQPGGQTPRSKPLAPSGPGPAYGAIAERLTAVDDLVAEIHALVADVDVGAGD